ncbi:hypothetical protein A3F00_03935 [Candidatus Daviesbacteria bacterium RIFCSPHIGHO2_12_FULL_37_11]|uniref:Uncharacterized protein n=1 Tax=Candidatus Daviesbacteria bacterium RIFCSPHIGHO2_12_FULL_37_11 TaxID=1797777 RepID=A0A1F5KBF2_9BACT|nr:MAG: hypothetical protein A2769_01840 [Candidatus Daviesbacteria bacterium RIFCSPHIGHO2_01_FULL_37_27]OGE38140.1 MAG: hypothetical protein A3F00_03935 [Candidatus Daviesbacteria bacterium RIFCSPHIGHO2_12_FULL_37_11]OGE45343.1 MAG: hypothetical protein A3B39_01380 [Candidatus Daviesbacteria bacterium RIFCSPLOWO2_01_FULL_37_10]
MKKLLLLAIVFFIFFGLFLIPKRVNLPKDPNSYITEKIKACNDQGGATQCLKDTTGDFMRNFQLKEILDVFEKNESAPEFFAQCHTALHFLGQGIYRKEKNVQEGIQMCSSVCFWACQHGVLEGYLKERNLSLDDDEVLKKEVLTLCQKDDREAKASFNECLHGLGHALMFFTQGELPRSLRICDGLKNSGERDWCYSGVFMENSTSSTNKDHPSKYLKADDLMYPCNTLENKYLNMCYALQGFYFAKISNYEVQKTIALCNQVPVDYRFYCFHSIGQERVGFTQNPAVMKDGCNQIEVEEDRNACIQGVIGTLAERYKGDHKKIIEFCGVLEKEDKTLCYQQLKTVMTNWITNSDELKKICEEIKEESFKKECLNAS